MRNPGAPGAFPQAQSFDTQVLNDFINRREQGSAKVAVMVSVGGFLLYGHRRSIFRIPVGLGGVKNITLPPTYVGEALKVKKPATVTTC